MAQRSRSSRTERLLPKSTSIPSMTTSPPCGLRRPTRTRKSVLFPEPDGPMMLTISPVPTVKLTPRRTGLSRYDAVRSAMRRSGKAVLHPLASQSQRIRKNEIQDQDRPEREDRREAFVVQYLSCVGQFDDPNLRRESRVFDEEQKETEARRKDHLPCLRNHDPAQGLKEREVVDRSTA